MKNDNIKKNRIEKTPFIKRMQLLLIVLTALLTLAAAMTYYIPHNAQSSGYTQSADYDLEETLATVVGGPSRQELSKILPALGIAFDLPGMSGGEAVTFIASIPVNVRDKTRPADPYNIVPEGAEVEMTFANLPDSDYRYRRINIKGSENSYKIYKLSSIRTEDLAALYVSYLQQTDQVDTFETATGLELSEENALAALTEIDRIFYENGISMPSAYPEYMSTAMNAFRIFRAAAISSLIVTALYFALTPGFLRRRKWNRENIEFWNEREARRLRFKSLKDGGERADADSRNKNPTRQEMFRDMYDLDKRNDEYKW